MGKKSYFSQIRIDPFEDSAARQMLDNLIGSRPEVRPLRQLILEKTEGRPLFIEEIVRSLRESGLLSDEPGNSSLLGKPARHQHSCLGAGCSFRPYRSTSA